MQAQDAVNCRVRVRFPDRNNMLSYWLPIVVTKSQDDKAYWLPDLGEQVVCTMDEHDEDGAVLGAIYSSVDTTPAGVSANIRQLLLSDGANFKYDKGTHALTVALPAGATMTVTANGATIEIDSSGNVLISPGALIKLAGGGPAIARVGDSTTCPAGTGSITSGSAKAQCG